MNFIFVLNCERSALVRRLLQYMASIVINHFQLPFGLRVYFDNHFSRSATTRLRLSCRRTFLTPFFSWQCPWHFRMHRRVSIIHHRRWLVSLNNENQPNIRYWSGGMGYWFLIVFCYSETIRWYFGYSSLLTPPQLGAKLRSYLSIRWSTCWNRGVYENVMAYGSAPYELSKKTTEIIQ